MKKLPIILLQGTLELHQDILEEKIKNKQHEYFTKGIWNSRSKELGLYIDLSQLQWAHIGALVQLTLFIESARKSEVQIYLALPTITPTIYEEEAKNQPAIKDIVVNVLEKRKRTSKFLKMLQFDRVIQCAHIENKSEIKLTETFDFRSQEVDIDLDDFYAAFESDYTFSSASTDYLAYDYKAIIPLTWLKQDNNTVKVEEFEKIFKKILSGNQKGISEMDALSLKNVIISELMKNVREHAGDDTKNALFAVGLLPTSILTKKKKKNSKAVGYANSLESEYVEWLYESNIENFIEIYFGDSGKGIINNEFNEAYNQKHQSEPILFHEEKNIPKYKLLKWAFDKWSTKKIDEKIRGTKGLYRIKRIVDKYKGIFLIRTGSLYGGFEKGGHQTPKWQERNPNDDTFFPGTLIQIKLCPYKEVTKFNFKFLEDSESKLWKTFLYKNNSPDEMSLANWLRESLVKGSGFNLLIIIDVEIKEISDELEDAFIDLSQDRALEDGIVVYFARKIGQERLEGIVDSVNSRIDNRLQETCSSSISQEIGTPDNEEIYDPIILMGKEGNFYWFGGDKRIITILNEIYQHKDNDKKITELHAYLKLDIREKEDILLHLNADNSLVNISKNDKIIFNFTNIKNTFKENAKNLLTKSIMGSSGIITPKLEIRDRWYSLQDSLNSYNNINFSIAMYLNVADALKNEENWNDARIFIDHSQEKDLAEEFALISGIKKSVFSISDDIDNNIPRRTSLFEKNEKVIILTTLISSSETVRGMIKAIMRDEAIPLIITSIANYRKKNIKNLKTWGKTTNIVSLYQKYDENQKVASFDKEKVYKGFKEAKALIDPDYHREIENHTLEKVRFEKELYLDDEIKRHLIKTESMHYGHIGKNNKRHFTLYLDKKSLLKDAKFIYKKYLVNIHDWLNNNNIKSFVLVSPKFEKENFGILDGCIEYIKKDLGEQIEDEIKWDSDNPKSIPYSNIVFIDFGSITGTSINKLLLSLKNTENIHISMLFSQLNKERSNLYNNIDTVTVPCKIEERSLFGGDTRIFDRDTKVDIRFMYKLPLGYYSQANCPICEHVRNLNKYEFDDSFMKSFYHNYKDTLIIKDRKKIDGNPKGFDGHNMSSIFIMEIYNLKLLLENSIKYTQYRILLFNYLYEIDKDIDTNIKNPDSQLYVFLYFISHELNWLQREPLVFKNIRTLVSNISLSVAVLNLKELTAKIINNTSYEYEPTGGMLYSEEEAIQFAVRYKFAAITTLRASNKFEFCHNISNMIEGSTSNNEINKFLLQNIFYHIHTLHENKYNTSKEYYEAIVYQLNKIKKKNILNEIENRTLYKLDLKNKIRIQKLNLTNDSLLNIKSLKSLIYDTVNIVSHPLYNDYFESLDFRRLPKNKDFKNGKHFASYSSYKDKSKRLLYAWNGIEQYISLDIIPILLNISEDVLTSDHFNDFYTRVLEFMDKKDYYENMIVKVHEDISYLRKIFDLYHEMLDNIKNLFLGYKTIEKTSVNQEKDSIFLEKMHAFPSNPIKIINSIFLEDIFKAVTMEFKLTDTDYDVFYPNTMLYRYLDHIKSNIYEKLNLGSSLSDVTINFKLLENKSHIILRIEYNNTNEYVKEKNPHDGGLKQFHDDLRRYGGKIEHGKLGTYKYCLEIEFNKYDRKKRKKEKNA